MILDALKRRAHFLIGTAVAFAMCAAVAAAATTVDNGMVLDLGGNDIFDDELILIDGSVENGSFDASVVFDLRFGSISADLTGDADLVKSFENTVTLSGTNTYNGDTTISDGTLIVSGGSALPDATHVTVGANGTLQVDDAERIGELDVSGSVVLNADLTIGAPSLAFSDIFGVISGTGGMTLTGNDQVQFYNDNTYTGLTTVQGSVALRIGAGGSTGSVAGDIQIDNGNAVYFYRSGDYSWDHSVLGNGVVIVDAGLASNAGVVTWNNANTANAVIVLNDTLQFGPTGSINTNELQASSNGIIDFGGTTQTFGRLAVNGGGLATSGTAEVAEVQIDDGEIAADVSTNGQVLKYGSGTGLLSGSNSFSGTVSVDGGRLVAASTTFAALGNAPQVNVASGATLQVDSNEAIGSLSGTGSVELNGGLTLNGSSGSTFDGVISGTGGLTLENATFAILTNDNTYTGGTEVYGSQLIVTGSILGDVGLHSSIFNITRDDDTTFAGNITGTGTFSKNGTGTLTLTGNNTFDGSVVLFGGTLAPVGAGALSDTAFIAFAGGALQLANDETIAGFGGFPGELALGSHTLTFGNNVDFGWGGTFTGDASSQLIKVGVSKYQLGDLDHLGTTVVDDGEINVNGTVAGSVIVNAGGRYSGTSTVNGDFTNLGTLASGNSPGTTTVLGNYTGGGVLDVEVQFDNAGSPINGTTHDFLNIAGDVLGSPTAVNLLAYAPSGAPAATTGNGIEIVRVGGNTSAADFTMSNHLLGNYSYSLVYLQDYSGSDDGFFLQSTLLSGCSVTTGDDACFIDDQTDQNIVVDALAGSDTLQLTGATNFSFDVGAIGSTYTNFETYQKAGTSTVTLTGVAGFNTLGFEIQNGTLVAGTNQLGGLAENSILSAGTLQVASALTTGSIAGSGAVVLDSDLTVGGNDLNTTFSGVISGVGGLTKVGAGAFTLSGANTYVSTTTVDDGTLILDGGSAIADGGYVFVNSLGTLQVDADETIGEFDVFGSAVLNADLTIGSPSFAFSDIFGVISGTGGLTLTGNDYVQFFSESTYTGLTTVRDNVALRLGNGGAAGAVGGDILVEGGNSIYFYRSGDYSWDHSLLGNGIIIVDSGFAANGGVVTWNAANTAGAVIVLNDTLQLGAAGSISTGELQANSSGIIDFGGTSQTVGRVITLNSGVVQNGAVTATADTIINGGGTISADVTGAPAGFYKYSPGAGTLSGSNSFSGGVNVVEGTLVANSATGTALGNTPLLTIESLGTLQLDNNETVGLLSGSGAITLNADLMLSGVGVSDYAGVISGSGNVTKGINGVALTLSGDNTYTGDTNVFGGVLLLGTGGTSGSIVGDVILHNNALLELNRSNNWTYAGVISGSGSLNKAATGATTLSGTNTFSGSVSIYGGTLALSGGTAIADTSNVFVDTAGTLQIDTDESISLLTGSGLVTLNADLTLSGTGVSNFGGAISGAGGLTKAAGGVSLTLTGDNTYTGATEMIGGTLLIGNGGNNGSIVSDVQLSAATMVFNRADTLTYGGNVSGTGSLYQQGGASSVTTLTGNNTFSGSVAVFSGTLALDGGNALSDAVSVTIADSGTLQLLDNATIGSFTYFNSPPGGTIALGSNTLTFGALGSGNWGGAISGDASSQLIKEGSGTQFFQAGIGHSGTTIVNDGTINVNGTVAGSIVVNAGGRYSGNSTINGDLTNLGTLASGNSPGTTTVLGNYTGGGILDVEVQFDNAGSPINGTTHDFLNIAGDVLGSPTAVNLQAFVPSSSPAATTGNGIEIVRVGGNTSAADFTMSSYLLGSYYYDLVYIQDYSGTDDGFFLQSTLATPGCVMTTGNDACFIDSTTNQATPVDALAGIDTLQLTGATNFNFNTGAIGTTYTNFETYQKAGTSTVTLTGTAGISSLGFDVQAGRLIASAGSLGATGANTVGAGATLEIAGNNTMASVNGLGTFEISSGAVSVGSVIVNHFVINSGSLGGGFVRANTHDILGGTVSSQLQLGGANTVNISSGANVASGGTPILWAADATGSGITIVNNGSIQASGGGAGIGALGTRNGALSITNTGTISSAVGTAINVGSVLGDVTITNSGVISGVHGIATGSGNDTLNLATTGSISGGINLGSGTNTLNLTGVGSGTIFGEGSSPNPAFSDWLGVTDVNVISGTWTLIGGGYYNNLDISVGATFIADDTHIGGATDGGIGGGPSGGLNINVDGTFSSITSDTVPYLYGENPTFVVSGNGVIDLTNGGGVVLAGANTFTGTTNIANGALVVVTGTMPGDFNVGAGGSLIVGASFSPSGVDGGGNPVIAVSGAGATGDVSGDVFIDALGSLTFNRTTDSTYAGQLSGNGKLVKDGTGMLSLSGNNLFTGGIDIMHGGVRLLTNTAAGLGPITTYGSVISYGNGVNSPAPIIVNSNTTQLEVLVGSAEQSGVISEVGGSRPIEKIGAGNLTLSATNTYTGLTTITDGTLTAQGGNAIAGAVTTGANGTFALNTSETITSFAGSGGLNLNLGTVLTTGDATSTLFSGTSSGAGGLTKVGSGTFSLTGANSFFGALNVNAGNLTVEGGSLNNMSLFNVASGASAFLGGGTQGVDGAGMTGSNLGPMSVANAGTLYLDDDTSVSTASLVMASGSNLNVFLTTNTLQYGQINVTGAANVGGATVGVYLDPMSFSGTLATSFTYSNVITAASTSGTFGAVNLLQTPSALFSVTPIYTATSYGLQVNRASFASGGGGGNQGSVGQALEDIFVAGTTDPDLINLINTVSFGSPSQNAATYAAVSGSENAETSGAAARTDDPWKQSVAERVNAARTTGCTVAGDSWCLRRYAQAESQVMTDVLGDPHAFDWLETGIRDSGTTSVWGRAIGVWGEVDGDSEAPGSRQTTGGLISGVDHVFDSLLLAGLAAQYVQTDVDFDSSRNSSVTKALQAGAYFSYGGAETYLNGNVSVIGSTAKAKRFVTVGLLDYDIESFARSWTFTASSELGTILEIDGYRFEPSFAVNYQAGFPQEYSERGGGGLSLMMDPEESNSLRTILGARISRVYDIGDRKIVPQLRIDWRHEMLDRRSEFDTAFTGAPNVIFHVNGSTSARDVFATGASVTMPITGRVMGYVDVQGAFSEDSTSGMLSLGGRATW